MLLYDRQPIIQTSTQSQRTRNERLVILFLSLTLYMHMFLLFVTVVVDVVVVRDINICSCSLNDRSEMCPPPRDAKKRAKGGNEEARPFYKIINIESREIDQSRNPSPVCDQYVLTMRDNLSILIEKKHTYILTARKFFKK